MFDLYKKEFFFYEQATEMSTQAIANLSKNIYVAEYVWTIVEEN